MPPGARALRCAPAHGCMRAGMTPQRLHASHDAACKACIALVDLRGQRPWFDLNQTKQWIKGPDLAGSRVWSRRMSVRSRRPFLESSAELAVRMTAFRAPCSRKDAPDACSYPATNGVSTGRNFASNTPRLHPAGAWPPGLHGSRLPGLMLGA